MAEIKNLKEGQILWDKHKYKMGNTDISKYGLWRVRVVSIDSDCRSIQASWNGNPERTYFSRDVKRWRVNEPKMDDSIYD